MEPVLLYGVPQGCSFGSIVALEWLGAPYRLARIEWPDGFAHPLYAQLNPSLESPVFLREDGRWISQSLAILNHIGARGVDRGLGFRQGSFEFDRLNETLSFLVTTVFSAFSPLWRAYKMPDADPSVLKVLRDTGRDQVTKAFDRIESLLAEREWLAETSSRTVADAYFIGIERWAGYHKVLDRADYPNLDRFVRTLDRDPGVVFARAVEEGREAPSSAFRGHVTLDDLSSRLAA